ncbi:RNA methyltransferase [Halobacteriales archaeon SW_7_68_16]|nr:MAG: RNA methyltransferase [Halobacteriales archaeon SW_7_68_16]
MTREPPVVAVVDAETPGNVGTIARAMKNFGFTDLKLVDPPPIEEGGEAYGFAGHARRDVLPNADAIEFETLAGEYHTVATTAITNDDARKHVRFPYTTPDDLADRLATVAGDTAIVFGREGTGLNNDELAAMDAVCSIPASADYPVLNLGQAATVTLYELRDLAVDETQLPPVDRERASQPEIERLHEQFRAVLSASDHPVEKRDKATRMFRRLVGRADPTEREASTLTGILRRTAAHADGEIDDD